MSGWNTAMHFEEAYHNLVDTVLEAEGFPHKNNIAFGELLTDRKSRYVQEISSMNMSDLKLDKEYGIEETGKKYGHLAIYAGSYEVTAEKAAEISIDSDKNE